MKILKYILALFISVSITSCNDESGNELPLNLTNENIVGTYNISSLYLETEVTSETEIAGVTVPFTVASSTSKGDTFQVDFTFNIDGTYEATGPYRLVSTVTTPTGDTLENIEIITINDSGNYLINTTNNTITFTSLNSEDLIDGILEVDFFDETTLSFIKNIEENEGVNTITLNSNITLVRE